jgi:hypothetical protein
MVIRIKQRHEIPEKYKDRLHGPFSNLFNAYTKSINKACGRSGSLRASQKDHYPHRCST